MSTTNISYSGKVKIDFLNQSLLYKNNGSIHLWKFLCLALTDKLSHEEWQGYVPGGIHLLSKSSIAALSEAASIDDSADYVLTSSLIPVISNAGNFYSGDNTLAAFQAQFTCAILSGVLKPSTNEAISNLSVALVSADNHRILAAVDIDTSILAVVRDNVQVNLSWTVGFENTSEAASSYLIDLVQ